MESMYKRLLPVRNIFKSKLKMAFKYSKLIECSSMITCSKKIIG